ncbi:hypothetical protein SAMN04489712_103383 [Thermomonospora echinospora]|uniref:RNA polymerase, alpha chain C terminal domain n=1 Tax=Thermomonospora echinospora TaxID=1992 RepID=A0A1H5XRU9_9ACTN|nr:hypothetical protein [Thermomonospora echinospora]SEG14509.1 hypothetical protein SAMN04489712_103383 [Thermomonospora echinospora]
MESQSPPLTRDCPLVCLTPSRRIINPLRHYLKGEGVHEPTVGDVLWLWQDDKLQDVRNLGPDAIKQIFTILMAAGLIHRHHNQG